VQARTMALVACLVLFAGCQSAGSRTDIGQASPAVSRSSADYPSSGNAAAEKQASHPVLEAVGKTTLQVIAFPAELLMWMMNIRC
jgi:hypothetical protein